MRFFPLDSPKVVAEDDNIEILAREGEPLTLSVEVQALPNVVFASWFYQEDNVSRAFDSNLTSVDVTGAEESVTTLRIPHFQDKYYGNITCYTSSDINIGDAFTFVVSPGEGNNLCSYPIMQT